MGRRKVDKELDDISRYLLQHGAYALKASGNAADKMILKALKRNEARIYRFWLGVFYALVLMVSLSWLPLFGPMIAGYVGGKRAGSPARGTLMAIIVIGLFYLLSAPEMLASLPVDIMAMRDGAMASIAIQFPWLEPATTFVVSYTTPTVTLLSGKISYTPQSYSILLVFAYVGGTLAMQKREEIRLLALSRITSSMSVQPILRPMPHHSAAPEYADPYRSFEEYGRIDPEFGRIYKEEFGGHEKAKRRRKAAISRYPAQRGAKTRSMKKEDLIKSASRTHHKTSRHGFL